MNSYTQDVVLDTCSLVGMLQMAKAKTNQLIDTKIFDEIRAGVRPRGPLKGFRAGRVVIPAQPAQTVLETHYGDAFWSACGLFRGQTPRVRVLGVELLQRELVDVLAAPEKRFFHGSQRVDRESAGVYASELFAHLYSQTNGGLDARFTGREFANFVASSVEHARRTLPQGLQLGRVDMAALEAAQITGATLVTEDGKLTELARMRNLDVAHPREIGSVIRRAQAA
jgi:hypothetical protein